MTFTEHKRMATKINLIPVATKCDAKSMIHTERRILQENVSSKCVAQGCYQLVMVKDVEKMPDVIAISAAPPAFVKR